MPTRTRRRILSADLLERERVGGFSRSVPFADEFFPNAFHVSPWMSWSASSGTTPARSATTSPVGLGLLRTTTGADADSVTWNLRLAAGSWSLRVLYTTSTDGGQVDVKVDGATVVSQLQMYSAGTTHNAVSTTTGIAVGSSGIHTVSAHVNGHDASSTDYIYRLISVSGVRTGA